MTFFKSLAGASAAFVLLAACGGGDTAPANNAEKTVEKPELAAATTPDTSSAPAPDAAANDGPAAEFVGFPSPYAEADYARGRRTFKLCQSCHTLKEGGANMVGPNLYGMFGREAGSRDDFAYSKALTEADFTWTPAELEKWLENPRTFLPGNKMSFSGVRKENDRHAVIAYIMAETGYAPSSE